MLIYRSFRMELKHKLKLFHTIMNGSVMLISFFGSIAAVYFHQKASITHFYSLHSWLGISTWLMFVTQFCSGFVAFLFPGASFSLRKMMMPYHRYFGIATFALASATCLTGINEKAIFAFKKYVFWLLWLFCLFWLLWLKFVLKTVHHIARWHGMAYWPIWLVYYYAYMGALSSIWSPNQNINDDHYLKSKW